MTSLHIHEYAENLVKKLTKKISLWFAIVITVAGGVTWTIFIHSLIETSSMSRLRNFAYWVQVGDTFELTRALSSFKEAPFISGAAVISSDGNIIASSADAEVDFVILGSKNRKYTFDGADLHWRVSYALVPPSGNQVGSLRIVPSVSLLWLPTFFLFSLLITRLIIAFVSRNASAIVQNVTRPFSELIEKINQAKTHSDLQTLGLKRNEICEIDEVTAKLNLLGHRLHKYEMQMAEAAASRATYKIARQVAHDIRSPVSALKVLNHKWKDLPQAEKLLLENAITRVESIANDVLEATRRKSSFSKPRQDNPRLSGFIQSTMGIEKTVSEICAEKALGLTKGTKVSFEVDDVVCRAGYYVQNISRIELSRVISNLLNNAIDSVPDGNGDIRVRMSQADATLTLSILDNGRGIDPKLIPSIFDEDFSTKATGNGLGLSHAKYTIEHAGGKIHICNREFGGCEVLMTFPLHRRSQALPNTAPHEYNRTTGSLP